MYLCVIILKVLWFKVCGVGMRVEVTCSCGLISLYDYAAHVSMFPRTPLILALLLTSFVGFFLSYLVPLCRQIADPVVLGGMLHRLRQRHILRLLPRCVGHRSSQRT